MYEMSELGNEVLLFYVVDFMISNKSLYLFMPSNISRYFMRNNSFARKYTRSQKSALSFLTLEFKINETSNNPLS